MSAAWRPFAWRTNLHATVRATTVCATLRSPTQRATISPVAASLSLAQRSTSHVTAPLSAATISPCSPQPIATFGRLCHSLSRAVSPPVVSRHCQSYSPRRGFAGRKWQKNQRGKLSNDHAKSKVNIRLLQEMRVAVRLGGNDPAMNARLQSALAKARANNVPREAIQRCLSTEKDDTVNKVYEITGVEGVTFMLEVETDSVLKVVNQLNRIFKKTTGQIAAVGAVAFNFDREGVVAMESSCMEEDELLELAADAGAQDLRTDEVWEYDPTKEEEVARPIYQLVTDFTNYAKVLNTVSSDEALRKFVIFDECGLRFVPKMTIDVEDLSEDGRQNNESLLEQLSDLDDTLDVYHNMTNSEAL